MLCAVEKLTKGFSSLIFSNYRRFFTKNECGQYSLNAQAMARSSGLFSYPASLGGTNMRPPLKHALTAHFKVFVEHLRSRDAVCHSALL